MTSFGLEGPGLNSGQRQRRAIFAAVRAFDVEALRRELAAGVDPNIHENEATTTLLHYAVYWRSEYRPQIRGRLECISVLLGAGASVDLVTDGRTPLHRAAENKSAAYHAVIAMLLEAGADPNFTDTNYDRSVLANAARSGTAGAVRMLISAGAVDLDRALALAISGSKQRNCGPLLRAGAAIQKIRAGIPLPTHVYIQKIRAAGGYKAYEKAHRQRLVAMFLAKFPTLPVEMLERVLEFTWDIGGH